MKFSRLVLAVLVLAVFANTTVFAQRTTKKAVTDATFSLETKSAKLSKVTFNKQDYKFVGNIINFPTQAAGSFPIVIEAAGVTTIDGILTVTIEGDNATVVLAQGKEVLAQATFPATTLTIIPFEMKPALYSLTINSNVKGASIVNAATGAALGTTGTAMVLPAGDYTVKISAPGFLDAMLSVSLQKNANANVELKPSIALLTVNANVKTATVTTNTGLSFAVGAAQSLPIGQYTITVSAPNYVSQSIAVDLSKNTVVPITLALSHATLTVTANVKEATVTTNTGVSFPVGTATLLPVGKYTITVSAANYVSQILSIEIKDTTSVPVALQPVTGTIAVTLPGKTAGQIFVNGVVQKATSFVLTPGTYTVKVVIGELASEISVTVQANQTISISPILSLTAK